MKKNIQKEIQLGCPPEQAWEALTNPEDISAWLMQTTDFRAEKGARFVMQAKPMGKWDGKIYGEVLLADKPKTLSYTWKGDQMKSTTVLTWTLTPSGNGTLLRMEHNGFEGFGDTILGFFHAMGWGRFLKQLQKHLL